MKLTHILLSSLLIGTSVAKETPSSASGCDALKELGKVYKNPENPYIQQVKLFGRAQWQYGYTEGTNVDGLDFDEHYTELRRLRAGVQIKFLEKFKLKTSVNLEKGSAGEHEFGYADFDTATLTYEIGNHLGLENIELSYGRQKLTIGAESHTSSRKIKTVERSNIGNFYYSGRRPTGLTLSASKWNTDLTTGIFSTEDDSEFIGGWNDGEAYFLSLEHGGWQADLLYNDVLSDGEVATEDDIFDYRWASSLAYELECGRWNILINGIYGELLNNQEVYGAVLMPSTFLIEEKLEAVLRYQFAASEDNNIKLTRRYAGEAGNPENGAKGSENHTIYAGLNYYLCGHRAKIQTGVEYETLERENGEDADATTFWAAFRMYF